MPITMVKWFDPASGGGWIESGLRLGASAPPASVLEWLHGGREAGDCARVRRPAAAPPNAA